METMNRILYIYTARCADDQRAWSGTMYRSLQALKQVGYEVDYLCASRDSKNTFVDKLWWEYWRCVPQWLGKNMRCDESFYSVRVFRQTLREFDYSPYDIVFVPTHIAIVNALPQHMKAKVVHLVDATVDSLFNYYTEFSNLLAHNYWEAHVLGKRAFRRSDLIIASSDWCKRHAVDDYGIRPELVAVVEFGANMDRIDIPAKPKELNDKKQWNIYWSGVNWNRKGGEIALVCCDELIRRGYGVRLHVTGIKDTDPNNASLQARDYVVNHGFLNKNEPNQYRELCQILKEMDLFLFPSKAECSSIALCEANGFGLPCFVYDTGGTANYVLDGKNGYKLPLCADGYDFADCIEGCVRRKKLNHLSQGAVDHFLSHLNWEVWGERVKAAMDGLF